MLAPRGGDLQVQPALVVEPVALGFGLGFLDLGVGQGHVGAFSGVELVMPPIMPPEWSGFHWTGLDSNGDSRHKKPRRYGVLCTALDQVGP